VPRGSVRVGPSHVLPARVIGVAPYRGFYGPRVGVGVGFYYGYPFFGGYPYAYAYPSYGYGYPAYGPYAYGPYAYGYAGRPYGGVRIIAADHDAEVYADGYYVGRVDDFDGVFQELNLDPGAHRIEIRAQNYAPISFDVYIEPGRTITYRATLRNP